MTVNPSACAERTLHVLVIDDDPSDRDFVRRALGEFPIACESIGDGEEALRYFDARRDSVHQPDLIFLDLNMPRRNGFEVLERIRREPGLVGTPVVVLSTSSEGGDVERCYRAGANLYLTKPSDVWEYMSIVRSAGEFTLRLRHTRREALATPSR